MYCCIYDKWKPEGQSFLQASAHISCVSAFKDNWLYQAHWTIKKEKKKNNTKTEGWPTSSQSCTYLKCSVCRLALSPLCCPSFRVQTSPVPAGPLLSAAAFFCPTGGHYCVIVWNDSMKDFPGLRFVCRLTFNCSPSDTERGGPLWLSAAVIRSCRTSLHLKDFSLSSGFCQYVCLIEKWSERQCHGQCKGL